MQNQSIILIVSCIFILVTLVSITVLFIKVNKNSKNLTEIQSKAIIDVRDSLNNLTSDYNTFKTNTQTNIEYLNTIKPIITDISQGKLTLNNFNLTAGQDELVLRNNKSGSDGNALRFRIPDPEGKNLSDRRIDIIASAGLQDDKNFANSRWLINSVTSGVIPDSTNKNNSPYSPNSNFAAYPISCSDSDKTVPCLGVAVQP